MNRTFIVFFILLLAISAIPGYARAEMTDMPVIKLQSLDKVSARTMTFEARVGSTVKFGSLYIKTQACRKAPPIDQPESAAFLQIWEVTPKDNQPHWVFSGWMFASSPSLSSMDHPIYDVWVLDCLERKTGEAAPAAASTPASEAAKMTLILPPGKADTKKKEKPAKAPAADTVTAAPAAAVPVAAPPAAAPAASVPDTTAPAAPAPDTSAPDASEPDAAEPDAAEPDATAPDASAPAAPAQQ